MAIKSDYITGTLTITQGSVDFTGTDTGWESAEFKEGDTLIDITGATEYMGVIESITGERSGTLTKPWEGPTLTNVPYRMRYQPDGARSTAQARNLIEILGNGNITAFSLLNGAANLIPMFTGPGAMTLVTRQALVSGAAFNVQVPNLTARAAYDGQDAGFAVLVSNIGDGRAAIYSKNSATSGDWSDPAIITGPTGAMVSIEAGITTTLPAGQDASLQVRSIPSGYALDLAVPRGPQGVAGTNGTNGTNGIDGATGPTGPKGDGLEIDATGNLTDRDLYNSEAEGFSFVDTENGNLYFRTGPSGSWSDPIPFGKGEKGDPGDDGSVIITTNGVGNGTPGPYTLNSTPISDSATWASISGVIQYNFTLSGNQITFGIPVPSGVAWQVKASGPLSVVEPVDGSVGVSKLKISEAEEIRVALGAYGLPEAREREAIFAPPPQGRLSLAAGLAVTPSDIAAATEVFYVPSSGNAVPIVSSGIVTINEIPEGLSLELNPNSAHAGYHQASKAFDFFIANIGGQTRLCTGPAWQSLTSRGSGAGTTELESFKGIFVNKNFIQLRYGLGSGDLASVQPREATWVGSFLNDTTNGVAVDTKKSRHLFNAFNTALRPLRHIDTVSSFTVSGPNFLLLNNDFNNRVTLFLGLDGVIVDINVTAITLDNGSPNLYRDLVLSLDGTNILPNSTINRVLNAPGQLLTQNAVFSDSPGIGFIPIHPMMRAMSGGVTWFGNGSGLPSGITGKVFI